MAIFVINFSDKSGRCRAQLQNSQAENTQYLHYTVSSEEQMENTNTLEFHIRLTNTRIKLIEINIRRNKMKRTILGWDMFTMKENVDLYQMYIQNNGYKFQSYGCSRFFFK